MYGALAQMPSLVATWADYLKKSGHEVKTLEYDRGKHARNTSTTIYLKAKGEHSDFIGAVLSENEAKNLKEFVLMLSRLKQDLSDKNVELHVLVPDSKFDQVSQMKMIARDMLVHIDAIWELKMSMSMAASSNDSRSSL